MTFSVASVASNLHPRRVVAICAALTLLAGLLTAAITSGPADPSARLEKARDLVFARKPEAALREVRRALAELGDDGDRAVRLKALARGAQIVDFHLDESRVSEALAYYRDLIREFPASPEAYDAGVRVSEILKQRLGDDLRATQQLLAVVDAFAHQAGVERLLLRASRIAMETRRYPEARASAERLLTEYADSELAPEAAQLVGTAFHLEGLHVEAVAAFERVRERWPQTAQAARALHDAGGCLAEQGDFARAMAHYIEALPAHPDPLAVQRSLERVRRRFVAQREMQPGSKAVAFGPAAFPR